MGLSMLREKDDHAKIRVNTWHGKEVITVE